jgi:hypothetical protein
MGSSRGKDVQPLAPRASFWDDDLTEATVPGAHEEDDQDEPTDIRPSAMVEALESAIAHALTATSDRRSIVPSLLRLGHWLGFTEHEVMGAIALAIEQDPDPSLDPERLSQVAAATISAVQLVERDTAQGDESTTFVDTSPFHLEMADDAPSTVTSSPI